MPLSLHATRPGATIDLEALARALERHGTVGRRGIDLVLRLRPGSKRVVVKPALARIAGTDGAVDLGRASSLELELHGTPPEPVFDTLAQLGLELRRTSRGPVLLREDIVDAAGEAATIDAAHEAEDRRGRVGALLVPVFCVPVAAAVVMLLPVMGVKLTPYGGLVAAVGTFFVSLVIALAIAQLVVRR